MPWAADDLAELGERATKRDLRVGYEALASNDIFETADRLRAVDFEALSMPAVA